MHIWKTPAIVIFGLLTTTLVECVNKEQLPFVLEEVNHAVAGRISYDAQNGDHVVAILKNTGCLGNEHGGSEHEGTSEKYLQLTFNETSTQGNRRFDITGMVSKMTMTPKTKKTPEPSETSPTEAWFERLTTDTEAMSDPVKPPIGNSQNPHNHDTHVRVHITNSLAERASKNVASADIPVDQSDAVADQKHNIHVLRVHRRKRRNVVADDTPIDVDQENIDLDENEAANDVTEQEDAVGNYAAPLKDVNADMTGKTFAIELSNAFGVDGTNHFFYVANSSLLAEHELLQFYVYLADEFGNYLSNPLPFIVYIDKEKTKLTTDRPEEDNGYPAIPAVFAGVLVLFIVFLALLIPFVTRAKRRFKQGKPMFKLGSHPSTADLVKAGMDSRREAEQSFDQLGPRRESREPNWYGNTAFYSYEEEVKQERDDFTRGIKRTYSNSTRREHASDREKSRDHPPTLQLNKKETPARQPVSPIRVASSSAAEGTPNDIQKYEISQRL